MPTYPLVRMRRLRGHEKLREMIQETRLSAYDLVLPLFVRPGRNIQKPIASIPGYFQFSVDRLKGEIEEILKLKIPAVLLFGIPHKKDPKGSEAYADEGIVQEAIRRIKEMAPNLLVITDVCLCAYTDHGHCGAVSSKRGKVDVDNDETLKLLQLQAISHVRAGADIVAPSGMVDGMVLSMRTALDAAGYESVPILSYSSKYASSLYGAFREVAESAPQFGDRQTYQMNLANGDEAVREVELDLAEGADIVMVKPALSCLDVIYRVKSHFPATPLAAYHVSGEYAMIKAAAEKKWLDEKKAAMEALTSIKRAGADFIITYFAKDAATWLS